MGAPRTCLVAATALLLALAGASLTTACTGSDADTPAPEVSSTPAAQGAPSPTPSTPAATPTATATPEATPAPLRALGPVTGGVAALWAGPSEQPAGLWLSLRITPGADPLQDPWSFETGVPARLRFSCTPSLSDGELRLDACSGLPGGFAFRAQLQVDELGTMDAVLTRPRGSGPFDTTATLRRVPERDEPSASENVTLVWHHDETASLGPYTDVWSDAGVLFAPHTTGWIELLDAATGERLGLIDTRAVPPAGEGASSTVLDVKARDGRLYVATVSKGLLVYDVSDPAAPSFLSQYVVFGGPSASDRFTNVHNIFLAPDAPLVFAINTSHPQTDLRVIDVSDPTSPREAGRFAVPGAVGTLQGAHDVHVVLRADRRFAYLNTLASGLFILDVTDPSAIRELGTYIYDRPFSHSGWIFDAGGRLYLAHGDEGYDQRLTLIDVTEPGAPSQIATFATRPGISIHNIEVVGGFAYVAYYVDGLRVLDLRDPQQPREVAHFDTVPSDAERDLTQGAWGVRVSDGLVFISDRETGIYALDVDTP